MSTKPTPLRMYFQALLVFNVAMLILKIVVALLNRDGFSAGLSLLSSLVTSILIFLPYFLFYINKLSTQRVVVFIPFFISILLLIYMLYNLWTGNWHEMSFGGTGRIKIWQVSIVESLIVLGACWRGYKYFLTESTEIHKS